MTTFGWKRKTGQVVKIQHMQSIFDVDQNVDSCSQTSTRTHKKFKPSSDINWEVESTRLEEEGVQLAKRGIFSEAVDKWNRALQLTPSKAKLLEMKAQALLHLDRNVSALQTSRKAVMCEPSWWAAHQTLGRTQLAVGDIKMAIVSFSRAIHINPENRELWEEDLNWALEIHQKQKELSLNVENKEPEIKQQDAIKNTMEI